MITAEIYISAEIDRNSTEGLECPETDWNLNRGGTGGIIVPDCIVLLYRIACRNEIFWLWNETKLITLDINDESK